MFHKQLMRQIIGLIGGEINKRTGFNTDPEKTPIVQLDIDELRYRIKEMRVHTANTDMVAIVYFEENDLINYIKDIRTFGKPYEIVTNYFLDDPELLQVVQQVLTQFDWSPSKLDRLFRMLKNINTN